MLKEIQQDVWELLDNNSVLCVLTNDSIEHIIDSNTDPYNSYTYLYNPMGGGIAYECCIRNKTQDIEGAVAQAILKNKRIFGIDESSGATLFRFSTKKEISDQYSNLDLIEESLIDLKKYCEDRKDKKIYLPRPGCGIGGLNWKTEVRPLVEKYLGNFENIYIVSK